MPSFGLGFFIVRIVTWVLIIIVLLNLIGLIPAIIIDVKKKKFHWSKWIIISFVGAIIIFSIVNFIVGILFPGMFDSIHYGEL